MPRVYCSGPLFNDAERGEMSAIAAALEAAGFETFLPHRDGFEFTPLKFLLMAAGVAEDEAQRRWDRAIFAMDAYQCAVGCDAVVVNLNGRVPDEGAAVEAALAFAAGRCPVAYKSDLRTLTPMGDNAMLTGLFGFRTFASIPGVVDAVRQAIASAPAATPPTGLAETIELGRRLWEAKSAEPDLSTVVSLLATG